MEMSRRAQPADAMVGTTLHAGNSDLRNHLPPNDSVLFFPTTSTARRKKNIFFLFFFGPLRFFLELLLRS